VLRLQRPAADQPPELVAGNTPLASSILLAFNAPLSAPSREIAEAPRSPFKRTVAFAAFLFFTSRSYPFVRFLPRIMARVTDMLSRGLQRYCVIRRDMQMGQTIVMQFLGFFHELSLALPRMSCRDLQRYCIIR
jgi:hypothetical protein